MGRFDTRTSVEPPFEWRTSSTIVPLTSVTLDACTLSMNVPSSTLTPLACDSVSVAINFARSSGSFSVHVKPCRAPLEHVCAANTLASKSTSIW